MIAPWIISLFTAIWYAWIGWKDNQNPYRWALQGFLFGLATSTLILGVCDASLIPRSYEEESYFKIKSLILSVLPMLVVGGCTMFVVLRRARLSGKNS